MARRSDHSREELYDIAMKAARKIVEKNGLQALTARGVAEAMGYSPGTLYNVFNDRNDMIVHLNGQTLNELYGYLSSATNTSEVPHDLRQLLKGYLEYLKDHRNLWEALFEYRLPEGQSLPDWYMEKIARLLGLIENALSPLFSPDDRDALASSARVLWASLHGICSLSESGKLQIISNQNVHEMTELLMVCFVSGLQQLHGK